MKHVIKTDEQDWPVTLTTHEGSLSGIVFIVAGGYVDIEVPISAIPRLIDALQAVYAETTTEEAPERIEAGEWPADDTHLRDYKWIDRDGGLWRWDDRDNRKSGWNWNPYLLPLISPLFGPWTRGERVE